jgi:glucokinase
VAVLVGDIGGTNSRLALFRDNAVVFARTYPSAHYGSLEQAVADFLSEARAALGAEGQPERASLAVAGPVEDHRTANITNLSWDVDARRLEQRTGIPSVRLVNDFEAAAFGVTLLGPDDLVQIGGGPRHPTGPMAVAGAGTGLGEAFLVWSAAEQRYQVVPSEGGHVDFAPRSALERGLAVYLAARYGRVSNERVVSGPAFKDLFAYLMNEPGCRDLATDETKQALLTEDAAAVIVRQAVAGRDPLCVMAVSLFASVLGAVLGNLALNVLATGGVFLAGGIAPRMLGMLQGGAFREAFESKGRFQPFLAKVPIFVVTHPELGLLGASGLATP